LTTVEGLKDVLDGKWLLAKIAAGGFDKQKSFGGTGRRSRP
jgi:hypothetical protein